MPEIWRKRSSDHVKEPVALRKYRSENGWERKKPLGDKKMVGGSGRDKDDMPWDELFQAWHLFLLLLLFSR